MTNIFRGQDIIADISDTAVILQRLRKFCKPVQNIADWVKVYLNVHGERAGEAGHNSHDILYTNMESEATFYTHYQET